MEVGKEVATPARSERIRKVNTLFLFNLDFYPNNEASSRFTHCLAPKYSENNYRGMSETRGGGSFLNKSKKQNEWRKKVTKKIKNNFKKSARMKIKKKNKFKKKCEKELDNETNCKRKQNIRRRIRRKKKYS